MSKGSNKSWFSKVVINLTNAGKSMKSVTVHCAWTTDTFSARSSERQSWVQIFLDIKQSIKIHRWDFLEVDVVANIFGLIVRVLWVVFIDQEPFHGCFLLWCQVGIVLYNVVRIKIAFDCRSYTFEEDWSFVSWDWLVMWARRKCITSEG